MCSRCPTCVVLVASLLLAPATSVVLESTNRDECDTIRLVGAVSSQSFLPLSPTPSPSVSKFIPLRRRPKTVLEEKTPRLTEQLSFDYLVIPGESIRFVGDQCSVCQGYAWRPLLC
jgi:hypothetical protein